MYHRPIIALGQSELKTVNGSVSTDDTSISIDNSGGEYTVGDHVFISDSSNENNQYLGPVLAATSIAIEVSIPVEADLGLLAKVWQPTYSVTFSRGYGSNVKSFRYFGVVTEVSRGSVIYPTDRSDAYSGLILKWHGESGMEPTDYYSLQSFLETVIDYTQDSFSLGYWNPVERRSRCAEVRWIDTALEGSTNRLQCERTPRYPDRFDVDVPILFVSEDGYAV